MKSIQQSAEIDAVVSRHSPEAKPYKFTASSTRPLSAAIRRGRRTQHNDDVTNIYSDAKQDAWPASAGHSLCRSPLHFNTEGHRIDSTREFDQHAVACRLDNAALRAAMARSTTSRRFFFKAAGVPTSSAPIRRL